MTGRERTTIYGATPGVIEPEEFATGSLEPSGRLPAMAALFASSVLLRVRMGRPLENEGVATPPDMSSRESTLKLSSRSRTVALERSPLLSPSTPASQTRGLDREDYPSGSSRAT